MSPPARRRGSKQQQQALVNRGLGSPPARRRGSKPEQRADDPGDPESPPARRRGSKPAATARRLTAKGVASCAEAWIENGCGATGDRKSVVEGQRGSVRVDLGGRGRSKKKQNV